MKFIKYLTTIIAAIILFVSCDVENLPSPDIVPPTVTITYPALWANVYNDSLRITIEANDENEIETVEVFFDGLKISDLQEPQYAVLMSMESYDYEAHTIYANAYDESGNKGTSDVITIYKTNTDIVGNAPSVTITSPSTWQEFSDTTIRFSAITESDSSISNLIFYVDGDSALSITSEPYQVEFEVNGYGVHSVYAKAIDINGNFSFSELVIFSVVSSDNNSPIVYITSPANWSVVSGQINVLASAIDNEGVDYLKLLVDGVALTVDETAPYVFELNTLNYENGPHSLLIEAYDNHENMSLSQLVSITIEN
ncbi:MAG: hypothetical protein ISS11_06655 [Candidatus Marinimicrobia bacterium]|nr:hypothetical protein [Candidatus Neomarinimicrobiota bacterium]